MLQLNTPPRRRRFARLLAVFGRRPQRSLALPALGAALGLLIAAFGLFRAAPRPVTTVPPGYAALVNQRPILMSDFMNQTQVETGVPFEQTTPAQRRQILHEMIDQELLVQRSLALDLPELGVEVRDALADGVNAEVAAPVLARTPSDAELRAFYKAHIDDYATLGSMNVRDIVLHVGGFENVDQSIGQAEADAEEAIYQLRSGAPLDYVMQHFGFVDTGRMKGEDETDFFAKMHLGADLFKAAAGLRDGEVSEPVVQPDGVHVLVMAHRVPPRHSDFDAVRDKVYEAHKKEQINAAEQENLKFLRGSADILLAPGQSE
jgi:hypothetical protein